MGNSHKGYTDFGFQDIPECEKNQRVKAVFDRVAPSYDRMNDVLSLGLHRVWKRAAVRCAGVVKGDQVLDLAAGTGDLTQHWMNAVGESGHVYMTDINADMLRVGTDRLLDEGLFRGVTALQIDAEALPFESHQFDCVSVGFGLRNMTHHDKVLSEAYRVLKAGGRLIILEFSQPDHPLIQSLYDFYSFQWVPRLAQWCVEDPESYQYLVESIRRHPRREVLKKRVLSAGFDVCHIHSMSGGIVSIHEGVKF